MQYNMDFNVIDKVKINKGDTLTLKENINRERIPFTFKPHRIDIEKGIVYCNNNNIEMSIGLENVRKANFFEKILSVIKK